MVSKASAGYLRAGLFVACPGISSVFEYGTYFTAHSKPGIAPPSPGARENLWTVISDNTAFQFTTTLHVPAPIAVKKKSSAISRCDCALFSYRAVMFHLTMFLYHRNTQVCVLWRCKILPYNIYCVRKPTVRYSVDYKQRFQCHFLWVVLYCFYSGQGHSLCWKFPKCYIGLHIVGMCLCAAVISLPSVNCVLGYLLIVFQ
jgi:hypothetical protein